MTAGRLIAAEKSAVALSFLMWATNCAHAQNTQSSTPPASNPVWVTILVALLVFAASQLTARSNRKIANRSLEEQRKLAADNRELQKQMAEMTQGHEQALAKLNNSHASAIQRQKDAHDSLNSDLDREHQEKLADLDNDHQIELQEINHNHETELATAARVHERELEVLRHEHQASVQLVKVLNDALSNISQQSVTEVRALIDSLLTAGVKMFHEIEKSLDAGLNGDDQIFYGSLKDNKDLIATYEKCYLDISGRTTDAANGHLSRLLSSARSILQIEEELLKNRSMTSAIRNERLKWHKRRIQRFRKYFTLTAARFLQPSYLVTLYPVVSGESEMFLGKRKGGHRMTD